MFRLVLFSVSRLLSIIFSSLNTIWRSWESGISQTVMLIMVITITIPTKIIKMAIIITVTIDNLVVDTQTKQSHKFTNIIYKFIRDKSDKEAIKAVILLLRLQKNSRNKHTSNNKITNRWPKTLQKWKINYNSWKNSQVIMSM